MVEEVMKEKRKWQIALRRYVLERQPSSQYAPYFGISIEGFRNWIQNQFSDGMDWDGFGEDWQFEHIISLQHFDLNKEEDLQLCWNFMNIRVKNLKGLSVIEVNDFSALSYFEHLVNTTQHPIAQKMVDKIKFVASFEPPQPISNWLRENKTDILAYAKLNVEDYLRINKEGMLLKDLLLEKSLLQKFGGV